MFKVYMLFLMKWQVYIKHLCFMQDTVGIIRKTSCVIELRDDFCFYGTAFLLVRMTDCQSMVTDTCIFGRHYLIN